MMTTTMLPAHCHHMILSQSRTKPIWALYERWCEAYEKERDHAEMTRWFEMFKNNAEYIYSLNSEITSEAEQLILGPYCDGFNEKDKAEFLNDFGHFNGVPQTGAAVGFGSALAARSSAPGRPIGSEMQTSSSTYFLDTSHSETIT
uniref:Uncharacterized protein n=1 Tax=Oryza rufipogon TaxID=4529 RepID=A0A0E0P212_ORYRU